MSGMTVDLRSSSGFRPRGWVLLIAMIVAVAPPMEAQTAFGEIEGRPAPVSRRQCMGGVNLGDLCNQDADCPGSTCQVSNLYNISVAVRFNATAAELTQIRNQFTAGSEVLFDATDGQAQFGQVTLFNNSTGNRGHYWITSTGGCGADTGSWGSYSGGNIGIGYTSLTGGNGPECVAHEFVHLVFDARDEYERGCGLSGSAQCPDSSQGTNSAGEDACLMECCARVGNELCWGQAVADNLVAGNHDAGNVTEQSRCRSDRSCWDQVGWSWPNTVRVPAGAPDPGAAGQVHQPLVFVQPPADARLVLVLDRSGSMSLDSPTRLQRLQTAALDVVDMAETGVELGVVSFSTTASDEKAVGALGANRSAWSTPVNNLSASGWTNIGDGLQHAYDMIVAAGGVTANSGIILMTDGVNNRPSGSAATDLQSKIDMLLLNGVPVWVTCTGDDLGLDSQCAEIATGTNGSYVDSADAASLPQRFVTFYEQILGRVPASSVNGLISREPEKPLQVLVETGARAVTFVVQWTDPKVSEVDAWVIDPAGESKRMEGMRQGRYLRVEKPDPGIWTLRLDFHGANPPDQRYVVKSFIDNPSVNAIAALRRRLIQPGEPFEICSRPLHDVPLMGLEIVGQVETPSGEKYPIQLLDDGGLQSTSRDEIPEDGKYCAVFTKTRERGAYSFSLRVVARDARPADHREPGIEYVEPKPVDFERWIEVSGTVDDRHLDQDHFKCYTARRPREVPFRPREVKLVDQFGESVAAVGRPVSLCPAVNKNGEGVLDKNAHLQCYRIEDRMERNEWRVEVRNQFGTELLLVENARTLCLPTIKNRERSRLANEHFKCYGARPIKEVERRPVTLQDQFGKTRSLVAEPVALCNPVSKEGERVEDTKTHLTCYRLTDRAFGELYRGRTVETENQFGRDKLIVFGEATLCVPSTKEVIE